MNKATKVQQRFRKSGQEIFYVAMIADSYGNHKQFSQDEVEKAGPGKFEVVESDRTRHIIGEFTPLAESIGPGWVKVPVSDSRRNQQQPGDVQERLLRAFERILPKAQAAIAARGPQDEYALSLQRRGQELTDRLMTLES
jgi:hypothetical protein